MWCNGSIQHFECCGLGSNPSKMTKASYMENGSKRRLCRMVSKTVTLRFESLYSRCGNIEYRFQNKDLRNFVTNHNSLFIIRYSQTTPVDKLVKSLPFHGRDCGFEPRREYNFIGKGLKQKTGYQFQLASSLCFLNLVILFQDKILII